MRKENMMNKDLNNNFTKIEKIQKVVSFVVLASLMIGIITFANVEKNFGVGELGLVSMLVGLALILLGSKIILPMFVKPENKSEGDEEEELFL